MDNLQIGEWVEITGGPYKGYARVTDIGVDPANDNLIRVLHNHGDNRIRTCLYRHDQVRRVTPEKAVELSLTQ